MAAAKERDSAMAPSALAEHSSQDNPETRISLTTLSSEILDKIFDHVFAEGNLSPLTHDGHMVHAGSLPDTLFICRALLQHSKAALIRHSPLFLSGKEDLEGDKWKSGVWLRLIKDLHIAPDFSQFKRLDEMIELMENLLSITIEPLPMLSHNVERDNPPQAAIEDSGFNLVIWRGDILRAGDPLSRYLSNPNPDRTQRVWFAWRNVWRTRKQHSQYRSNAGPPISSLTSPGRRWLLKQKKTGKKAYKLLLKDVDVAGVLEIHQKVLYRWVGTWDVGANAWAEVHGLGHINPTPADGPEYNDPLIHHDVPKERRIPIFLW